MNHIPVGWLQLTRDKRRFATAVAGVAFAVVLILVELGLYAALHESATKLIDHLEGDLIVTSSQYQYLISTDHFTRRRLYSALAVTGVESVAPIYVSLGNWRNPQTLDVNKILIVGFLPGTHALNLRDSPSGERSIEVPDTVLFDAQSLPEYGPIAFLFKRDHFVTTEINGQRTRVGGLFSLGPGFGANGHVITSDLNFVRLFPDRQLAIIDLGLIRLKAGTDIATALRQVREIVPHDVRVITRAEFIEQEVEYWNNHVPLGFVFQLGALMGLIVGGVIVYQILFSDVSEQLSEYATLKAIGHLDRSLFVVVLNEAFFLSFIGFVPGYLLAQLLYYVAREAAGVPIHMTAARGLIVLALTLSTCTIAGSVAMRKLKAADPADVF